MHYFDELPMELRDPGMGVLVECQREELKGIENLEVSLEPLWSHFETERVFSSGGRRRGPIDAEKFQQAVDAGEQKILKLANKEQEVELLRQSATQVNKYIDPLEERLGESVVFARAEFGLRSLIFYTVKDFYESYGPDFRVRTWSRALYVAEEKAGLAQNAWEAIARNYWRWNPHGD